MFGTMTNNSSNSVTNSATASTDKDALMRRIDQASFAMDDVVLYLDTHPTDQEALNYYHYVAGLRKEALESWQAQYGPLLVDAVKNTDRWTWVAEKWPWEGEV
jgi:spore coat protein JB